MVRIIASILLVASFSSATAADTSRFFSDRERGWFWYEVEPEPIVVKPEKKPEQPVIATIPTNPESKPDIRDDQKKSVQIVSKESTKSEDEPPVLSSAWFRKNMDTFRDRAVDDPTPENVSVYYYLQRVAMDKSEKFAEVAQRVVMGDPVLDENNRRPLSTAGGQIANDTAMKNFNASLDKIAKTAGIWFFFRSDCEYCHMQASVLKSLQMIYKFNVMAISLDGRPLPNNEFPNYQIDRGQAASLGVEKTPSLFLVRPPKDVIQLSAGMLAMDEIGMRIIQLATANGWMSEGDFARTRPVNKTLFTPKSSDNGKEFASSTPSDMRAYIRSRITNNREVAKK